MGRKSDQGLFRFKITKDHKLPKQEEINTLKYVIIHFQHELENIFQVMEDLIYLGKAKLALPKDEYIPF